MKILVKSMTYKVYRASKLVKHGHMSNICQTFETTEFHKFQSIIFKNKLIDQKNKLINPRIRQTLPCRFFTT